MSRIGGYDNRILVIGPTPPPYHGVAVMTGHIVQALERLGRCAGHLDTRDPQPLETIGRFNVSNVTLGLRHAWRLHRLLRGAAPITVVLPISQGRWGFLRDAAFVLVIRLHRGRLVLHLHGAELDKFYSGSGPIMRRIIRAVFRRADTAWALTPGLQGMFDGLVPTARVTYIENITPSPNIIEADGTSDSSSRGDSPVRVLYLANLRHKKGVFDLIKALHLLGRDARDWVVRLVGAGSLQIIRSLQLEIAALSAEGGAQVELLSPRYGDEKWMEYEAADIFVFPPNAPEGQPLVLLEAMAAGLPTVTTDIGGIPGTVRDGIEGIVIAPGNVRELADALYRLSSDPDLRRSLGAQARARYEERYQPERLQSDLAKLVNADAKNCGWDGAAMADFASRPKALATPGGRPSGNGGQDDRR
jgi:glycosyltransferase involved in cell wall biosynthesis